MKLSQKRKIFSKFFLAFCKFGFNFEHFQKRVKLIADVFLNLQTLKDVVRYLSKKSRFRGPFDK